MIRFDSSSKSLLLTRSTTVDGVQLKTAVTSISLEHTREDVRQVAISIAKLAITYANGGVLDKPRVSKSETGEERKLPSFVAEFETLLQKLFPQAKEGSGETNLLKSGSVELPSKVAGEPIAETGTK